MMKMKTFTDKLEIGAMYARTYTNAKAHLGEKDAEKALNRLDNYASECVGLFESPVEFIKELFFYAADTIR